MRLVNLFNLAKDMPKVVFWFSCYIAGPFILGRESLKIFSPDLYKTLTRRSPRSAGTGDVADPSWGGCLGLAASAIWLSVFGSGAFMSSYWEAVLSLCIALIYGLHVQNETSQRWAEQVLLFLPLLCLYYLLKKLNNLIDTAKRKTFNQILS